MQSRRAPAALDRSIAKPRANEVSASALALLFCEIVQYSQSRVQSVQQLEEKLALIGEHVGRRVLETVAYREKGAKRETKIIPVLSMIAGPIWKHLFGRTADLERSTEKENEYMLSERESLVNRFVSVPKDLTSLNCAAFNAGVVRGALTAAEFPSRVTAHFVEIEPGKVRTTLLIRLEPASHGTS